MKELWPLVPDFAGCFFLFRQALFYFICVTACYPRESSEQIFFLLQGKLLTMTQEMFSEDWFGFYWYCLDPSGSDERGQSDKDLKKNKKTYKKNSLLEHMEKQTSSSNFLVKDEPDKSSTK